MPQATLCRPETVARHGEKSNLLRISLRQCCRKANYDKPVDAFEVLETAEPSEAYAESYRSKNGLGDAMCLGILLDRQCGG